MTPKQIKRLFRLERIQLAHHIKSERKFGAKNKSLFKILYSVSCTTTREKLIARWQLIKQEGKVAVLSKASFLPKH